MATTRSMKEYIEEQCALAEGVRLRPMMGEYLLYCKGKLVGGIYDDRLLVKPTAAAQALLPEGEGAIPYEGAKAMLLVENVEDRAFLKTLLESIADEIPEKKRK